MYPHRLKSGDFRQSMLSGSSAGTPAGKVFVDRAVKAI